MTFRRKKAVLKAACFVGALRKLRPGASLQQALAGGGSGFVSAELLTGLREADPELEDEAVQQLLAAWRTLLAAQSKLSEAACCDTAASAVAAAAAAGADGAGKDGLSGAEKMQQAERQISAFLEALNRATDVKFMPSKDASSAATADSVHSSLSTVYEQEEIFNGSAAAGAAAAAGGGALGRKKRPSAYCRSSDAVCMISMGNGSSKSVYSASNVLASIVKESLKQASAFPTCCKCVQAGTLHARFSVFLVYTMHSLR